MMCKNNRELLTHNQTHYLTSIYHRDYFRNNSCDFSKRIKNTKTRYHIHYLFLSFFFSLLSNKRFVTCTICCFWTVRLQTRMDLDDVLLGYRYKDIPIIPCASLVGLTPNLKRRVCNILIFPLGTDSWVEKGFPALHPQLCTWDGFDAYGRMFHILWYSGKKFKHWQKN